MTQILIPVTAQLNFTQTVLSHGWYMLAPFDLDRESMTLAYTYQMQSGEVLRLSMRSAGQHIAVEIPEMSDLSSSQAAEISTIVRTIFNIDWDLTTFYAAMRDHEGYDWLEKEGKGRILIGASLWEDLAKVLFTTNTSWAQTISMSQRLCDLGQAHPTLPATHAFPTAQTIAAMDFDTLTDTLRAGYRTAYLHALAKQIANGDINLSTWYALGSDALYQQVKSIKGYGDYAAGTIVRMLGYFDKLAIDSACREMYATLHNNGEKGDDKAIKAHYANFGDWKGLVMWMDIMRR